MSGFASAQSAYDHAEPDGPEPCNCPANCPGCEDAGIYCCGRCGEEYEPDPDDERERRLDRGADRD